MVRLVSVYQLNRVTTDLEIVIAHFRYLSFYPLIAVIQDKVNSFFSVQFSNLHRINDSK